MFEADITACFDEIDHTALMGRVRARISDKGVLGLVTAFLRSGILSEDAVRRDTTTGTPQGGILSPLLANIALSALDEHFTGKWAALGREWTRAKHRRGGGPVMKLVRYADDFVVMVGGRREHAEALWDEVAAVLAPMGLRLSDEKSRVCHLDEGFDFLGWRIQRQIKPGTAKRYVYTWPSRKAFGLDHGQGAHPDAPQQTSHARRRPAPTGQPRSAGMVQLLQARGVQAHVQLCRALRLVANRRMAAQTSPRPELGNPGSPLSSRMEDQRRRGRDVPAHDHAVCWSRW